jgi:hypothetical protein
LRRLAIPASLLPLFALLCAAQVIAIPQKQSDAQLRKLLEPYQTTQLLHFGSLEGAFGTWEDPDMVGKFQARQTLLLLLLCCHFWHACACVASTASSLFKSAETAGLCQFTLWQSGLRSL